MNKTNPLVSIVFTSYNHLQYLSQALVSILNQTYRNFELIIIDDCSTDGSQDFLKNYPYDSRINLHLLNKNTGSYVKASNYGAKLASGYYLLFAQCDDFSEPHQLETLVSNLNNQENVGVVFSRSNLIDKFGNFISDDYIIREFSFRKLCKKTTIIQADQMRYFLSFSCVIPNLSAALIKRELYNMSGGLSDKYLIASDWDFWLKLTAETDFLYIAEPLNNFRQHDTTIRSTYKASLQIVEIHNIIYQYIRFNNIKGMDSFKMKIGAGSIWFSYFVSGAKINFEIFYTVFRKTFEYEKLNILFFLLGIFKPCKEYLIKKII
jgi:glycosyltransferase involved in cell wall biosynthesis